jgi:hypothetical protein
MRLDPDTQIAQEIMKGINRIGENAEEAMDWILKFSQLDLTELSQGDLVNLQYEIAGFRGFHLLLSPPGHVQLVPSRESQFWLPSIQEEYIPQEKEIRTLQGLIRERIKDIIQKPPGNLRDRATSLGPANVQFSASSFDGKRSQLQIYSDSPSERFLINMAFLFALFIHHLHACLDCQKIFRATRTDQKYCSLRCQSRVALMNFRQKSHSRKQKPGAKPSPKMNKQHKKPHSR